MFLFPIYSICAHDSHAFYLVVCIKEDENNNHKNLFQSNIDDCCQKKSNFNQKYPLDRRLSFKKDFFREIESYFIRLLFMFTLKNSTGPCACKDIDIINNCNYCYLPFKLLEKNWGCQYFKLNLWWKISPSVCLPLRLRSSRSYESAYLSRRGREGMMSRIICLVKQVHFSPSHIHTLSWLCK